MILEPQKINSVTVSIVSPSICHEVMGPDAMILVFWILSFKPTFSLSSFIFIKSLFSSSLSSIKVVSSAYLRLLIFFPAILIPAYASSSPACLMMYSAYKLNKQGDNIQPWHTPFPIWNQSVVPCPVLAVASGPAYKFLRRHIRWSGIPISFRISQFVVIHTVKGFGIIDKAEVDVFLWRRQWQPTPILMPGKYHGWRSLVGCGPWGRWESHTTEWLHFHFSLSCTGEGNGNPLQCSCLENPRDGGAWWAAVYGVAQSGTWLKQFSSSSSSSCFSGTLLLFQWSIWSLVPLPFLNPAWTSGSSQITFCWSLT